MQVNREDKILHLTWIKELNLKFSTMISYVHIPPSLKKGSIQFFHNNSVSVEKGKF